MDAPSGPITGRIKMRPSPARSTNRPSGKARLNYFDDGPGGEGGSAFRSFLASPTLLSEHLPPAGLLAVSLLLSALLVGLVTAALAP